MCYRNYTAEPLSAKNTKLHLGLLSVLARLSTTGVKSIWHRLKMGYFVNSAAQPKHTQNIARGLHLAVTYTQAGYKHGSRPQSSAEGCVGESLPSQKSWARRTPNNLLLLGYVLQGERPSNLRLAIIRRMLPCQMPPRPPSTFQLKQEDGQKRRGKGESYDMNLPPCHIPPKPDVPLHWVSPIAIQILLQASSSHDTPKTEVLKYTALKLLPADLSARNISA